MAEKIILQDTVTEKRFEEEVDPETGTATGRYWHFSVSKTAQQWYEALQYFGTPSDVIPISIYVNDILYESELEYYAGTYSFYTNAYEEPPYGFYGSVEKLQNDEGYNLSIDTALVGVDTPPIMDVGNVLKVVVEQEEPIKEETSDSLNAWSELIQNYFK